jgi:hypothetical protein
MMQFFISIRSWLVGVLLAAAAVFFGYQAYTVWHAGDTPEVGQAVQKPPRPRADRRVVYQRNLRISAYDVIARKNLFSSDRREKLPEKSPAAPVRAAKPLDSRFALFGIVINGDQKEALVTNLGKKTAAEKEIVWVKVGDQVGTLKVSEIQPELITMTRGGSSYTVRLVDQDHPKKRSVTRKRTKRKRTGTTTQNITKPKTKSSSAKGSKTPS